MKITTNNVPRWTIGDYCLTEEERKEFDYLDWPAIDAGNNSACFFRYKGRLYDIGDMPRVDHSYGMEGWDAYHSDSAWSGILIKLVGDEKIVVGRYTS